MSSETRPASALDARRVAIHRQSSAAYPEAPPFHPAERYPELPADLPLDPSNAVFGSVRELFRQLGLDAEHFGTPAWNPLGALVRPGDTVFLKPNMIAHRHRLRDEWDSVITHGSVIRAVAEYVVRALEGRGRIWIGDAPQQDSLWDELVARQGLAELRDHFAARGIPVEILDLRDLHHVDQDGIYVAEQRLPGDPRGSVVVDLAKDSLFAELDGAGRRYYGAYYDWKETNAHHHEGRHEYAISRSPIEADVFINLPKLKTHKKCGLTVNLKSLVGINANKNWLPHYALGSPRDRGDQFRDGDWRQKLENSVVLPAKRVLITGNPLFQHFARRTKKVGYGVFGDTEKVVRSGNWHGNDTVWRMSLDLNRILLYANPDGTLRPADRPKRYFSVVDGIVAMEGNGPVAGTRRETGLLIGGSNAAAVDTVCARLMGFDPERLALVRRAWDVHRWPIGGFDSSGVRPVSGVAEWNRPLAEWRADESLRFAPHFGWTGAIEWSEDGAMEQAR